VTTLAVNVEEFIPWSASRTRYLLIHFDCVGFTYEFQAVRQHDGKLAAEGYIKCIAVNSEWTAVKLPPELVRTILEKGR
jgi:acyl-CoA thioesterase FadM